MTAAAARPAVGATEAPAKRGDATKGRERSGAPRKRHEVQLKREALKDKLRGVFNDETSVWRTRAKQHWLREGDGNTKFFHSVANSRRRANRIDLVVENGVEYHSLEDKKKHFYHFFKTLFTPPNSSPASVGDWSSLFTSKRIPAPDLAKITESFTIDEIKKAVFQLGSDKAPGPDGFPLRFYQVFWDTVKEDIMCLFQEMFEGRLTTDPIDYTYICLIPKKEGAKTANDYRPISLLNGIQKILSKVLANRLELVMDHLISSSQSAFLKGRNITDAYVTVAELLSWGNKKAIEGVAVKVDSEKAYDRIDWRFLFRILRWWGFDDKWCGWIELCVCHAKVGILVNGEATNWIQTKRGVRQGDPLSPFLFLMVAECLTRLANEALRNNLLKGKGCLLAWKNVCKSKSEGGLGILDVRTMNCALLTKWWWKFHIAPQLQWNRVIRDLYYQRRRPLMEGSSFRPQSYWWKGVLSLKLIFKWGSNYILGNGCSTDFWLDRWCGETTLGGAFPKIYQAYNRNKLKVNDVLTSDGWNWNRIFGSDPEILAGINDDIAELKDRISHLTILQRPDKLTWRWSPNGLFSVKSTYLALTDGGTRDPGLNLIWKLYIPLKVKVFCWLTLKKRLPTTDLLVKRGWVGNVHCVLCGADAESVDHLFTKCVFTKFIIVTGVDDIQARDLGSDVNRVWAAWRIRSGGHTTRNYLSELVGCWWSVWKARNDTIFRSIHPNPTQVVHMFKQLMKEWDLLNPARRTSV
ncbi:uncharacterized protein LOC109726772 [Ananas comosus]|uniref:Uncharacterized protein LOC109726772 n=1 Tax=Ananas comosus TaxID=4615 RepID=A0A6P5GW97_ANACO|nr:uncharacterized protein LOC109726772 [Ananas comosus]